MHSAGIHFGDQACDQFPDCIRAFDRRQRLDIPAWDTAVPLAPHPIELGGFFRIGTRRYRHRYVDGWQEKDVRAAMIFGRAFELALGAYFRREDPGAVLFREWSACRDTGLQFSSYETWDRMLERGIMLLTRFCQDDRVRVVEPRRNLQVRLHVPWDEISLLHSLMQLADWTENTQS